MHLLKISDPVMASQSPFLRKCYEYWNFPTWEPALFQKSRWCMYVMVVWASVQGYGNKWYWSCQKWCYWDKSMLTVRMATSPTKTNNRNSRWSCHPKQINLPPKGSLSHQQCQIELEYQLPTKWKRNGEDDQNGHIHHQNRCSFLQMNTASVMFTA